MPSRPTRCRPAIWRWAASPNALLTLRHGWQRGLVPVGLAALQRAITLNDLAARTIQAFHARGRPAQPGPG